jgi:hypothetical protein
VCIKAASPTTCASLATSPLSVLCQPAVLATDHELVIWGPKACATYANATAAEGAVYDTTVGAWTPIETVGAPLWLTDSLVLLAGRRLVVLGGWGNQYNRYRYDLDTHVWTSTVPAIPNSIPSIGNYSVGLVLGSLVLVLQNQNPKVKLGIGQAEVWLYDPSTDKWTVAPPFPLTGRVTSASAVASGKFVAWGGLAWDESTLTSGTQPFNDGAVYDPVANKWTVMPSAGAPPARGGINAAADPATGMAFVFGGGRSDLTPEADDGAVFDLATNTWTAIPVSPNPPKLGQYWARLSALGNRLVVQRDSPVSLAVYDASARKWTLPSLTPCAAAGGLVPYAIYKNKLLLSGEGTVFSMSLYDLTTGAVVDLDGAAAADARVHAAMVWTGSRLVGWGGDNHTRTCLPNAPANCTIWGTDFTNGFSLTW